MATFPDIIRKQGELKDYFLTLPQPDSSSTSLQVLLQPTLKVYLPLQVIGPQAQSTGPTATLTDLPH